ncbi:MAG: DUF1552 domain-containing protein [Verrucomicrobiota bacterium]
MSKPWHLDRRTFLKGVGVCCMLPYMESMGLTKTYSLSSNGSTPRRMCFVYLPNGVSMPPETSPEYQAWNWFPIGEGRNYTLTNNLKALEPHRDQVSILGGLSHPRSRKLLGHIAGDTWLTGGDLRGAYDNSVSVDQVAAEALSKHTRYPSLVLSTDGGVGYKSRATTLSYDRTGRAVPAEHNQREIFERYFSPGGGASTEERRRSIEQGKKIVDLILDDSKRLQRRLGKNDHEKLDEYMTSLNSMEEQIQRNEKWLDVPFKDFDASHIDLSASSDVDAEAYVRSVFDLIVLGFQIDLTRVSTFMMAREDGMGFGDQFPNLALGIKKGHHSISHDKSKIRWEQWGKYDQWLSQQFAYFVEKLKTTSDEHGPLIDNTLTLYGSACSNTHNARNYPLVLAGGSNMGVKHGTYTVFDERHEPMSNLFVSMLNAVGVETDRFSDSTGKLSHIFT